ncbi:hypothetical protein BN133_3498 [Cronobacter dublinensis 582]|nr:hypothetical protein BN133_3498 [Cronobacter dublinensis 582]
MEDGSQKGKVNGVEDSRSLLWMITLAGAVLFLTIANLSGG